MKKIKWTFFIISIVGVIILLFISIQPEWSKQLDKDILYLDIDSVHRTLEEKQKFNELKESFLNQWLDTSNCFMEDFQTGKFPDTGLKRVVDVYIDNILFTPTYDSVIVLVSFYATRAQTNVNGTMEYIPMKAFIDSLGRWSFDCNYGNGWIVSEGKDEIELFAKTCRRMIVVKGVLKSNKNIDPDFIHKFFTEDIEVIKYKKENWLNKLLDKIPESGPIN